MYIIRGRLGGDSSESLLEVDVCVVLMSSSKKAFSLDIGVLLDAGSRIRVLRGIAVMTCTVIGDMTNGEDASSSSSSFSLCCGDIERGGSCASEEGKCRGLFGSCSTDAAVQGFR